MANNEELFHGELTDTSRIICTPSAFARASLLHLQEIGTLRATKRHTSRRENLNSFLFFVVLTGSGELVYDGSAYELTAGDCVFIDCRRPYYHTTGADLWSLSWAHFAGPTMNSIYAKYLERGGRPVFRPKQQELYRSLLSDLHNFAHSDSHVKDMKINEGLSALLVLLMEDSWNPENRTTPKQHTLWEIKHYLDANYSKKITLDELSERYYVNKFYLTRIFKEQFGKSITAYLTEVRINRAKQDLRFTQKTAEEIAEETGFQSGYYFSRIFKKAEGISPTDYRKQWK